MVTSKIKKQTPSDFIIYSNTILAIIEFITIIIVIYDACVYDVFFF